MGTKTVIQCDNRGHIHPIVAPGCQDGQATMQVTVEYSQVESDTLRLCPRCADLIARDARRHGYRVKAKNLKGV